MPAKATPNLKNGLAEVVVNFLKPFQKKYNALTDEEVLKILREGAEKVRPLAKKKLEEVKKKVGFVFVNNICHPERSIPP